MATTTHKEFTYPINFHPFIEGGHLLPLNKLLSRTWADWTRVHKNYHWPTDSAFTLLATDRSTLFDRISHSADINVVGQNAPSTWFSWTRLFLYGKKATHYYEGLDYPFPYS